VLLPPTIAKEKNMSFPNRVVSGRQLGLAHRLLVLVATAGCLVGGNGTAQAYDKDTHFALTYYLAIQVGYNLDEARAIASTNAAVDISPKTQPLQMNPFVLGDFHAFSTSSDPVKAAKEIAARKDQLWQQAVKMNDPAQLGVLLHFLQDEYSHKGYQADKGHLGAGHLPDYIGSDPKQAKEMARATVDSLRKFMKEVLKREPEKVDNKDLDRVIDLLGKVNRPDPMASPNYDLAKAIVQKELGFDLPKAYLVRIDDTGKVRIGFDDNVPKGGMAGREKYQQDKAAFQVEKNAFKSDKKAFIEDKASFDREVAAFFRKQEEINLDIAAYNALPRNQQKKTEADRLKGLKEGLESLAAELNARGSKLALKRREADLNKRETDLNKREADLNKGKAALTGE
jgi:hypothetical protein